MLKLAKDRVYRWPVTVRRADNGQYQEAEFTAHFRVLTTEQLAAVARGEAEARDVLDQHLVGWEGISDDNGPLVYSAENKALVLADLDIFRGLIQALMESSHGAARKN